MWADWVPGWGGAGDGMELSSHIHQLFIYLLRWMKTVEDNWIRTFSRWDALSCLVDLTPNWRFNTMWELARGGPGRGFFRKRQTGGKQEEASFNTPPSKIHSDAFITFPIHSARLHPSRLNKPNWIRVEWAVESLILQKTLPTSLDCTNWKEFKTDPNAEFYIINLWIWLI